MHLHSLVGLALLGLQSTHALPVQAPATPETSNPFASGDSSADFTFDQPTSSGTQPGADANGQQTTPQGAAQPQQIQGNVPAQAQGKTAEQPKDPLPNIGQEITVGVPPVKEAPKPAANPATPALTPEQQQKANEGWLGKGLFAAGIALAAERLYWFRGPGWQKRAANGFEPPPKLDKVDKFMRDMTPEQKIEHRHLVRERFDKIPEFKRMSPAMADCVVVSSSCHFPSPFLLRVSLPASSSTKKVQQQKLTYVSSHGSRNGMPQMTGPC